jgi:hypothetical protein
LMFGRRLVALAAAVWTAAAMMGLAAAVAGASARAHSRQPVVVRPRFQAVHGAVWIWTGARYALTGPSFGPGLPGAVHSSPATLIDDQTGQVKTVAQPGCYPALTSGLEPPDLPWVPFDCAPFGQPPAPELYSPATGQWMAVSPSPAITNPCGVAVCDRFSDLTAAGRYWLAYSRSTCDGGGQHCSASNLFQNIQTGELRQDPSGGSTAVDLNAPNLTVTVCRPLTVPTAFEPYAPGPVPGSLLFYGSFALAIGGDDNRSDVYLERCGTHLQRLLTTAPSGRPVVVAANTHEVVWMAHPGFLNALTLPGLRPVTIRLPKRLVATTCSPYDYSTCVAQIALTNRRLYLLTASPAAPQELWVAPDPLPAQRHK